MYIEKIKLIQNNYYVFKENSKPSTRGKSMYELQTYVMDGWYWAGCEMQSQRYVCHPKQMVFL
jgi:hypothetical protein